jgi:hypothetical protein
VSVAPREEENLVSASLTQLIAGLFRRGKIATRDISWHFRLEAFRHARAAEKQHRQQESCGLKR